MSTKQLLDEAQKAIQNKDFPTAILKCKEVLKKDETHNWALVLLGAAYKDLDKKEAVKYLKLAASTTDNPKKALQGLFHCSEIEDLPDICQKLLELTPAKFIDIHKKLVIVAVSLPDACLDILKNEILIEDNNERVSSAYARLYKIFMNLQNVEDKWKDLYKQTLKFILGNIEPINLIEKNKIVLEEMYEKKQFKYLWLTACNFAEICPNQLLPLEWICKLYCENFYGDDFELKQKIQDNIETYVDLLLSKSSNSIVGLMALGLNLFFKNNYLKSREYILRVNKLQPSWEICLKILATIYQILGACSLAEFFYRQLKIEYINLAKCLVEQNVNDKNIETIKLCKELLPNAQPTDQATIINILAKALIYNGQMESAQKIIDKLISMTEVEKANMLLSLKYKLEGNIDKSTEILETNQYNSFDYYLAMGEQYFTHKNYQKSLTQFMKAATLEPYNTNCFFWLGKNYLAMDDTVRATKCLEKCVYLHPQHEQGVILLSAIYRQSMEWDENNNLLQSAVVAVPGQFCNWAWVLLGFHYLAQKNFNEAITAFRVTLRANEKDMSSWEGLADAYLQRGSLNSAMKVYQKISELEPSNPYPKLQVANIKTFLRLHKEAVICYEELLLEYPKYFPALKGIAEAHLGLTYHYLSQRLLGRCKFHAEEAVKYLTEVVQIRSNFACLWRLLANAFETIASLPLSKAFIKVPGSLANVEGDFTVLYGEKLYELAARFYCRAIKIKNTDTLLWYELSRNYYLRALKYGNETTKKSHLELAAESAKHTIKLAPASWKNWNLLGIICTTKEINNLPLAQHCFIKALNIDKKSAVSWTNLGILYLSQNEIKLANKAFSRSQQSDTGFINSWTGQAYIAERIGESDEAMDLFKHCTSLGYSPESAIGFTHWVCSVLNNSKDVNDRRYRYAIENLHAVPLALDSINWFCNSEDEITSLESLCFLGYLYFHQKNYRQGIKAFRKALKKSTGVIKDQMLCNLGYCYLTNGESLNAINAFQSVTEATFQSTIGLALSHFKASQYEESYSVYESALQWLASNDGEKSMILVAMSAMVYAFQGEKDAKTLLFQCIGLPNPPVEGLFAGCALGILHQDMQLSELVLQELKQFEKLPKYAHHIAFLTSQFYLKNNNKSKALIYLLSEVHAYPNNALIRKILANFLLKNCKTSENYLVAASRIAESTIALQQKNLNCENSSMEAAKSLAMASEAMRYVDQNVRKKLAQRAVHLNPTCMEARGALIICIS